jgi:hypothetical protein
MTAVLFYHVMSNIKSNQNCRYKSTMTRSDGEESVAFQILKVSLITVSNLIFEAYG